MVYLYILAAICYILSCLFYVVLYFLGRYYQCKYHKHRFLESDCFLNLFLLCLPIIGTIITFGILCDDFDVYDRINTFMDKQCGRKT